MSSKPGEWSVFSFTQWIYWLGATIVAALTAMVFLYSTFQTKLEANDNKNDLERRLERIEGKIDLLLVNPVRHR